MAELTDLMWKCPFHVRPDPDLCWTRFGSCLSFKVGSDPDPVHVGPATDPVHVGMDTDPGHVGMDTDTVQVESDPDSVQVGPDTDPVRVGPGWTGSGSKLFFF
jgi:hypothetical protein